MIKVWLKETSQPLVFKNVKNSYEKGQFYCIYADKKVVKIPIQNIFKLEEDYDMTEERPEEYGIPKDMLMAIRQKKNKKSLMNWKGLVLKK